MVKLLKIKTAVLMAPSFHERWLLAEANASPYFPIQRVCEEHSTEEHDLRYEEHPHSERSARAAARDSQSGAAAPDDGLRVLLLRFQPIQTPFNHLRQAHLPTICGALSQPLPSPRSKLVSFPRHHRRHYEVLSWWRRLGSPFEPGQMP